MKSMTGYGKNVCQAESVKITIEMKAVNNRFLEINLRLPKLFLQSEDTIKKMIAKTIKRGTVDVFFTMETSGASLKEIAVDLELARCYVNSSQSLALELGVHNNLATADLLKNSEIVKILAKEPTCDVQALAIECIEGALLELDKTRESEGKAVYEDIFARLQEILQDLDSVEEQSPKLVQEYQQKLKARIQEQLQNVPIDEVRLVNEVAFFCDKADINEEIQRIRHQVSSFLQELDSKEPVGRKLDFLTQELHREINTLSSKSSDISLTTIAVNMKNTLEKIKEQVRNVE